jgi:hypothetical protein
MVIRSSQTSLNSSSYQAPDLRGRVALVAGATRGVGRGGDGVLHRAQHAGEPAGTQPIQEELAV